MPPQPPQQWGSLRRAAGPWRACPGPRRRHQPLCRRSRRSSRSSRAAFVEQPGPGGLIRGPRRRRQLLAPLPSLCRRRSSLAPLSQGSSAAPPAATKPALAARPPPEWPALIGPLKQSSSRGGAPGSAPPAWPSPPLCSSLSKCERRLFARSAAQPRARALPPPPGCGRAASPAPARPRARVLPPPPSRGRGLSRPRPAASTPPLPPPPGRGRGLHPSPSLMPSWSPAPTRPRAPTLSPRQAAARAAANAGAVEKLHGSWCTSAARFKCGVGATMRGGGACRGGGSIFFFVALHPACPAQFVVPIYVAFTSMAGHSWRGAVASFTPSLFMCSCAVKRTVKTKRQRQRRLM